MTTLTIAVGIAVSMLLGTLVQSVAGMGFGMIAVPVMVILVGPADGVLWGNIAGLLTASLLTITKWKLIEWRKVGIMCAAGLPVIFATVFMIEHLETSLLDIFVGGLMLAMVIFSVFALKLPQVHGLGPLITTGVMGAFLSGTVAQSGPAMAAYAQASRWEQRHFAASIQPYFLFLNSFTVPLKLRAGIGTGIFHTPLLLVVAAAAIVIGIGVGHFVNDRLKPTAARNLALVVAAIGAITIFVRGVEAVI